MIVINKMQFDMYEKTPYSPKSAPFYTHYKDGFYICEKYSYPISVFLDVLDHIESGDENRYILIDNMERYLLFSTPFEKPIVLQTLDSESLKRMEFFSSNLELVNFSFENFKTTNIKNIHQTIRKIPKITKKWGLIYLLIGLFISFIFAISIKAFVVGKLQDVISEKTLQLDNMKTQIIIAETQYKKLLEELTPEGTASEKLTLPIQEKSFLQKANNNEELEQIDINIPKDKLK